MPHKIQEATVLHHPAPITLTLDSGQISISLVELLVHWAGLSHRRNQWLSMEAVRGYKGFRKAENFYRRWESDERARSDPSLSPDELERMDIQRELDRGLVEDYKVVERVVAVRQVEPGGVINPDGGTEYLCKWQRLTYAECTWEPVDTLLDTDQPQIDAFLARNESRCTPHRSQKFVRDRAEYKPFLKQPEYLSGGGELRDYQLLGVNWMAHLWHNFQNGILADEMVHCTIA